MKRIKLLLPILFILSLISCTDTYEQIDSNRIHEAFILNSSATFKGYFYHGSDRDFHYFLSKWELKDNHFKLKKEDLTIDSPFEFKTNELRIDLFETDKGFGSNQYYELFIVE